MNDDPCSKASRPARLLWFLLPLLIAVPWASSASAQEDEADDELLREGAEVYSQVCSACHQPGGIGINGQFPPLIDNPRGVETEYLKTVIIEGVEGELVVSGVSYDGRMPAFSTMPEQDIEAVTVYIQSGFASPGTPTVTAVSESNDGGAIPGWLKIAGLAAIGVWLLAMSPRIIAVGDRLELPWLDAWAKSAVIVIWFVLFTVFVPSWVLQSDSVSKMADTTQDLVGVGVWSAGLVLGIWTLWWAHREKRV